MALTFPQAEAAVVGSLLIDPDPILGDMMAAVSPEDFSTPAFRHIYEAARGLWLEQRPVDAMTIPVVRRPPAVTEAK